MWILKGLVERKDWGLNLSLLPQVLPNIMTMFDGNFPPSFIWYMPCSMARNFLPFWETAYDLKPQHIHSSGKLSPCHQQRFKPISTIFWRGKWSILPSVQNFGEMCIIICWNNSHHAKLANNGALAFGLVLLKIAQSLPTMFITLRQKNPTNDITLLHKTYGEWSNVEKSASSYD